MTTSHRVGHHFLDPRATNGATQHLGDHYAGDVYQNFNQFDSDPLDLLPAVCNASFDAASRQNGPFCLDDTRVEILERIMLWSDSASNDKPIFWISGMAGTGKSTIARTIALKLQEKERVLASFFFVRDNAASESAKDFFTTIAKQLATSEDPALREKICAAIRNNRDIVHKAQRLQWQRLVLKPLTQLCEERQTPRDRPLAVIIIDALDECNNQDNVREILRIICGYGGLDHARLRIIITSRPETPIQLGFEDMPHILYKTLSLDDVSHEIVNADLTVFFNHRLKEVRGRHGGLSSGWPGADSVTSLVTRCGGLFIYAATLSRFLLQNPKVCHGRLNLIMEEYQVSSNNYLEPLDRMYLTILRVSADDTSALSDHESETLQEHFNHVVGSIVVLQDGISAEALALLLRMPMMNVTLECRLKRFLQDAKRFLVLHGGTIAVYPLQIYSSALIFSPRNSLVRRKFSLETSDWLTKYHPARDEWDSSLFESDGGFPAAFSSNGTLLAFTSFAGWPDRDLQVWNVDHGTLVYSMRLNAQLSSVAFDPTAAHIAFSIRDVDIACDEFNSTDPDRGIENACICIWNLATDSVDHVLRGHTEKVEKIVFSPNGTLLATTSSDHTAKIWDAHSGLLRCTLAGDSGIPEISFSSDSNMVASLLDNSALKIWDRRNDNIRSVVAFDEVGSFSEEASLAFALDDHLYAAKGSRLVICDVYQSAIQRRVELMDLDIDFSGILRNEFASDGSMFAVHAVEAQKVYLWRTADLSLCSVVSAVSDQYECKFELSNDGAYIAISDYTTIRVFEVTSGIERVVLNGDHIEGTKFAPHANTIASGSTRCGPITLWDISQMASPTDASVTEQVHQITASTDRTSIIFTSSTSDPRKSSLNLATFGQDHASPSIKCVEYGYPVDKVQLLPESQFVFVRADILEDHASGYPLESGAWAAPTHIPPFETLTVSPSGFYLALAGIDHRIYIRHTSMQEFTVCLTGHHTPVRMIQFSPSDKQLVSVSTDGQVLLWDTEGQSAPVVLEYGLGQRISQIREGIFSADEKMLACAYWDHRLMAPRPSVQLWILGTGERSRGLDSGWSYQRMRTLSFSPDGRYLRTAEETFDLSKSPTASLDLGTPMIVDPYN
ncbi:hypothetical protein D6C79_04180 [Aureobasidium pullulans]|nr:hypothetical protein D6C79_04180 [Aureobasidium pullulans]